MYARSNGSGEMRLTSYIKSWLFLISYLSTSSNKSVHEIWTHISYAQKPTISNHTVFCLSLYLHPYTVYASSDGSSESAHMRTLTRAFVA